MAEDWAIDVKKYVPDADDKVIAAIVRYCGIALRNRDSSLVSFTDPAETDRVRENYCRKKLALTDPDPVIDAAIAKVGERMKGDNTRNRVTVYYLLAETFGKLGLFGAAAPVVAAPVVAAPVVAAPVVAAPVVAAPVAAVAVAAAAVPLMAAAATPVTPAAAPVAAPVEERLSDNRFALMGCGVLAAIILGAALFGSLIGRRAHDPVPIPAQTLPIASTVAPAAAVAIPEGSGVVAVEVDGKPKVSVYFDTAKTDIAPDFAAVTAPVKAYVDSHPGARLAVSGFNDPRGDAAFNAELSKNRAKSVAAALATLGVPADAIDLEKPPETTDTDTTLTNARRVDITVKDPS